MGIAESAALATITRLSGLVEERFAAARAIKNAVVGNPTNKRLFIRLGALLPLITAASEADQNPQLAEQAVAALGSLASLVSSDQVTNITPVLLSALFSTDVRPVNAAARALKMLVCSQDVAATSMASAICTPKVAERLVLLLSEFDEGIAEVCAVILASSVAHEQQARVYKCVGAVPALVMLLCRTNHERCVEACLNAMAALARQDASIAQALANPHNVITLVLPFTRSPVHALRLSACRLLTIFHCAAQLPVGLDGTVTTALVGLLNVDDTHSRTATAHTLAELVLGLEQLQKIATEAGAIEKLAEVVRESVERSEEMDTDMQTSSATREGSMDPQHSTEQGENKVALRAAVMTAIAALCGEYDDAREKVISEQVLPYIVDGLAGNEADVVLACVKCIRSLSRSVKVVRRDIANNNIGRILLNLLSAKNREIQRFSSATLCNLVLEFSPVRAIVTEIGGTNKLICLLTSDDEELRKNALWALKNLLFKADSKTKSAVMEQLGYDNIQALCADKHPRVRELAMTVVRNLACSGFAESQNRQLDILFGATGDRLISLLSDALRMDTENSEIAVQALYVVCNIASGTEEHKAYLMDSEIPQLILRWTSHEDERARIAAVWCAINLSWKERPTTPRRSPMLMRRSQRSLRTAQSRRDLLGRQHLSLPSSPAERREMERLDSSDHESLMSSLEDGIASSNTQFADGYSGLGFRQAAIRSNEIPKETDTSMSLAQDDSQVQKSSGYEWRIERLRELGFEGRLRSLVNDPHIEVQGRARAALELFDCSDVDPLDYDPSTLLDYNSSLMARQSPRSAPVLLQVAESDSP